MFVHIDLIIVDSILEIPFFNRLQHKVYVRLISLLSESINLAQWGMRLTSTIFLIKTIELVQILRDQHVIGIIDFSSSSKRRGAKKLFFFFLKLEWLIGI